MTAAFQGIGIASSCAIALGPAFIDMRGRAAVVPLAILADQVEGELERLEQAVAAARNALNMVRKQIPHNTSIKIAEFIDAHLLMLEDVTLIGEVRRLVSEQNCNVEWALQIQCDTLLRVFDAMDDPYLRARRDDIEHVVQQIQSFLRGDTQFADDARHAELNGCIVVAHDLSPADTILLCHRGAVAFVTESGGPTSHTALLARSFGIPAVVGIHDITRYLQPQELLVVDGKTGTVFANNDAQTLAYFRGCLETIKARQQRLRELVTRPCRTRDGVAVNLLANLELPEDVHTAKINGAAGVGLYRTEFLYMNRRDLPDEEEHFATYAAMIAGLAGIPLTIRTLDLGGDKTCETFVRCGSSGANPALGLRGIRLCLKEQALFRPQLRAILRASALGPVRLMLPLITHVHELNAVLALLTQLRHQLDREGLRYDATMPVGAMIEVPAAALCARAIAQRMDFLSIGTNDLIQYTLAIDRMDDAVNYLFDPLHPAILHLIQMVIDAGRVLHIPVSMCGEMAGNPRFTRLLLGLGLREFSMPPGALLDIKEIILAADVGELRVRAQLFAHHDDVEPSQLVEMLNQV